MYDLIVAGGGIAGLAVAEIFARSGAKTLLLEGRDQLCSETSGLHHEWFHCGSLYSIFPNPQFLRTLVGGIDDLLVYYRDFDGMNLRVTAEGRLITIPRGERGWLRDDTLDYAVATIKDPDFDQAGAVGLREKFRRLRMKHSWNRVVQQFVARHERFHDYDWRRGCASYYIPKLTLSDYLPRLSLPRFHHPAIRLDERSHLLEHSFDRPMRASSIMCDLLRSFLSYGGQLRLGLALAHYESRGHAVQVTAVGADRSSEKLDAGQLIIATGRALEHHTRLKVKVTASPLLVVYPAVFPGNVVRLIPFVEKTVNHLHHSVDGYSYSVIGGGYAAPADDPEKQAVCRERLLQMAETVFPAMAAATVRETYMGYKSELISSGLKRNYLYRIEKISPGVHAVVPGKFSLCFSLAVNTYRQITGHYPNTFVTYDRYADVGGYVAQIRHRGVVQKALAARVRHATV